MGIGACPGSPLCLTDVSVFAEIPKVVNSLCTITVVWELESNIILSSISLCALISTLFGLVLCCLEITTIASLVVSFQNYNINFRNLMLCTSCTTAVSNTLSSTMLLLMKGFLRSFNTLPFTVATRLYSQVWKLLHSHI